MSNRTNPTLRQPVANGMGRCGAACAALWVACAGLLVLLRLEGAAAVSMRTPGLSKQGLVYTNLALDATNCPTGFRIQGTELCTHGPDAAPQGVDVHVGVNVLAPRAAASSAIVCDGDGTSGKRIQIMYVRAENRADRYAEYAESIRIWAAEMDEIFAISARATGGSRRIRFVTDAQCRVDVLDVVVPLTANDTFRSTIRAIRSMGYNSPDRKYVMFVDANIYCGIATAISDSSASAENRNNRQAGFARIDSGCWSGPNAAHELVHLLGGVQQDAPNATGSWHCTDEFDLMCYSDTPNYPALRYLCPIAWQDFLDCNHDDYFHTAPPSGSYLATHWNVADSAFLLAPEGALIDGPGDHPSSTQSQVFLPLVTRGGR